MVRHAGRGQFAHRPRLPITPHAQERLHAAVVRDDVDDVEEAMATGISPDTVHEERTALYRAAECGSNQGKSDSAFIRSAKEERFDGTTPAYIAAREGHAHTLELLISAKANVLMSVNAHEDADNSKTERSLAWAAAQNGRTACLQLLIDSKADLHKRDRSGSTPAFKATENCQLPCLLLLVQAGADLTTAPTDHASFAGMAPLRTAHGPCQRVHSVRCAAFRCPS
eukprot:3227336-Prymnesium_polylepis.2